MGETLSSGTGACGAAVAAFLGGAPSPITVRLDGGQLGVEITEQLDVTLTGEAERVYRGELDDSLLDLDHRALSPPASLHGEIACGSPASPNRKEPWP